MEGRGSHARAWQVDQATLNTMDLTPEQITAFMVGLKSKTTVFHLQRAINNYSGEPLLAILPGVALQELWKVIGRIEQAMLAISACVVLAGLTGMFGVLLTSVQQRRRELALMRAIGASPRHLLLMVLLEAVLLTAGGMAGGLGILWGILLFGRETLAETFGLYLTLGWPQGLSLIVPGVLLAGILAGTLPALSAWRYTLADGLTPKS